MSRPARVIPWNKMTPQQKYDHMRYMHGTGSHVFCDLDFWHHREHARTVPAIKYRHTHDKETP